MTNYDIWLQERQKQLEDEKAKIERKQQELFEMTPLQAAAIIDRESDLEGDCYLEKRGEYDFVKCSTTPDYIGCVGCVKQYLLQEVKP